VTVHPVVAVVGLGPAGADLVTVGASKALREAPPGTPLFFRTARHPAAAALLEELASAGVQCHTFDDLYESGSVFSDVYSSIVDRLLAAAAQAGRVLYAVPGSPLVAERTVELLFERAPAAGVAVEIEPGLSFCDLAWASLRIDPTSAGVRIVDGMSFASAAAGDHGPLLVAQAWSRSVVSDIKLSIEQPAADQTAVVLHHLGLPDELVAEVPWSEIDRTVEPDHLTSLYLPRVGSPVAGELVRVAETIARLRRECPWDKQQTHQTLVRHMLEETYEAMEALEGLGDSPEEATAAQVHHAAEELGDLLCQVVFHANIAREEGLFDLADVARILSDKLIRRHPHVFGDGKAETADDVIQSWEEIKRTEKARQHILEGIPAAMPSLARAAAVERKLKTLGLGFNQAKPPTSTDDPDNQSDHAPGQVLLQLARRLASKGIDPEAELRRSLNELMDRVATLESQASAAGVALADLPPDESSSALRGGPVHI
jgi:tetrapyrrole methylase family protein / MazG family protein